MRNSLCILAALSALLTGCGNKTLTPVTQKVPTPADTPQKTAGNCPTTAPDGYHVITVSFPKGRPSEAMAIKFPGDLAIRVSECPGAQPKQIGPTVSLTRVDISSVQALQITVHHNYGWVQSGTFSPPAGQEFELFETKCDGSAPVSIYSAYTATPLPLTFTYPHVNGITCAETPTGSAQVSANDVEDQNPGFAF